MLDDRLEDLTDIGAGDQFTQLAALGIVVEQAGSALLCRSLDNQLGTPRNFIIAKLRCDFVLFGADFFGNRIVGQCGDFIKALADNRIPQRQLLRLFHYAGFPFYRQAVSAHNSRTKVCHRSTSGGARSA